MDPLPTHVVLQRGEQVRALIRPDFQVQILAEMLLGALTLIGVVLATIGVDYMQDRPLRGMGSGILFTTALIVGPIFAQRILTPNPVYVLTQRRLIVNGRTSIPLDEITRLQVWLTGIYIRGSGQSGYLQHLTNPAAVARLIHDTIAREGRA